MTSAARLKEVEALYSELTGNPAPSSIARSWSSTKHNKVHSRGIVDYRSFVINSPEYKEFIHERFSRVWQGLAFVPCPRDLSGRFRANLGASRFSDSSARSFALTSPHYVTYLTDLIGVIWRFCSPKSPDIPACLRELESRGFSGSDVPEVVSLVARAPNRVKKLTAEFQRLRGRLPSLKEIRDVAEMASHDDAVLKACVYTHSDGKSLFRADLRDRVCGAYQRAYGRPVSLEEFEAVYGRVVSAEDDVDVEEMVRRSHTVYLVAFQGTARIYERFLRLSMTETAFLYKYYSMLAEFLFDDREPKEPAGDFLERVLDSALMRPEYSSSILEAIGGSVPPADASYAVERARAVRAAADSPELRQVVSAMMSERKEYVEAIEGVYRELVRRGAETTEVEEAVERCRVAGSEEACGELRDKILKGFEYKTVLLDRVREAAPRDTASRVIFGIVEAMDGTVPTDSELEEAFGGQSKPEG